MPDASELDWIDREEVLTDAEVIQLVREVFIPLGFDRFRLTGGEPLLRPGLTEIVAEIANLPGVRDLALTTNAYALAGKAQELYDAGLRRINISLDSLDADTFARITGRDLWQQVWKGIQTAYEVGFDPLKLNMVVMPGINDREVEALAALSIDRDWHVRFIEFMPIGNDNLFDDLGWIASETLRQRIRVRYGLEEATVRGERPCRYFQDSGSAGYPRFYQSNVRMLLRQLQSHSPLCRWLVASLSPERNRPSQPQARIAERSFECSFEIAGAIAATSQSRYQLYRTRARHPRAVQPYDVPDRRLASCKAVGQ